MFVVIAIMMILLLCCVAAEAETTKGKWGENLSWTLNDDGLLTISGEGKMADSTSGSYFVSDYKKVKQVDLNDIFCAHSDEEESADEN